MGVRILAACEIAGLSVPEQVAVICRGNSADHCETAPIPLSAIDMDRVRQGRMAIQQIKRLSDGGDPLQKPVYVPVKGLVERRSTDIIAVSDARVAKAMRFMWDNIKWPITVDDVALELNMSRSTLEKLFRRTLARGVNGELRRKRLEVCKELLRSTKLPLAKIANDVGWSSRRHLHRAFSKTFGMTPMEYRASTKPQEVATAEEEGA
jgi:LacI family transcriptional regulator